MCSRTTSGAVDEHIYHGATYKVWGPDDKHLYIILSDPSLDSSKIYVVNFTSWKSLADPSCIVCAGEHPFVKRKTWVYYRNPRMESAATMKIRFDTREFIPREPVSGSLLARILAGAASSKRVPADCRKLLLKQGLISPAERTEENGLT